MIHENIYECDACGKKDTFGAVVADQWVCIEASPTGYPSLRRTVRSHACSVACERAIHHRRAREEPPPELLEHEAMKERPDLARALDAEKRMRADDVARDREEIAKLNGEIFRLEQERDRAQLVTKRELVDLLRTVVRGADREFSVVAREAADLFDKAPVDVQDAVLQLLRPTSRGRP